MVNARASDQALMRHRLGHRLACHQSVAERDERARNIDPELGRADRSTPQRQIANVCYAALQMIASHRADEK